MRGGRIRSSMVRHGTAWDQRTELKPHRMLARENRTDLRLAERVVLVEHGDYNPEVGSLKPIAQSVIVASLPGLGPHKLLREAHDKTSASKLGIGQ